MLTRRRMIAATLGASALRAQIGSGLPFIADGSSVLAAREKMTVPALCAAALVSRVSKVYLAQHMSSWRSVAEDENASCPMANIVPEALAVADLPQIARSLAPRQVIAVESWDAAALTKAARE